MLAKKSLLDTVCLWDQLMVLNLCSLSSHTWVGTSDLLWSGDKESSARVKQKLEFSVLLLYRPHNIGQVT